LRITIDLKNTATVRYRKTEMTELEAIAQSILRLKKLLRIAWETIEVILTPSERREVHQMQSAASDLLHALQDFQLEHDCLRKMHSEKCESKFLVE